MTTPVFSWVWAWVSKTVTTLSALATHLWDDFTVRKALVIAPKNVANNVWAQECDKWDHLTGIRCSVITGTAQQREAAVRAPADLYIINRENVVWLTDLLGGKLPYDMVILDELSSFKSTSANHWATRRATAGYSSGVISRSVGTIQRRRGCSGVWECVE